MEICVQLNSKPATWCDQIARIAPRYYWDDLENQRQRFDCFAAEHSVYCLDDWYAYSNERICHIGGRGVMNKYGFAEFLCHVKCVIFQKLNWSRYNGSISKAMKTMYPNFNWKPWFFNDSFNKQRRWYEAMAEKLNVKILDDWYKIDSSKISEVQHTKGTTAPPKKCAIFCNKHVPF